MPWSLVLKKTNNLAIILKLIYCVCVPWKRLRIFDRTAVCRCVVSCKPTPETCHTRVWSVLLNWVNVLLKNWLFDGPGQSSSPFARHKSKMVQAVFNPSFEIGAGASLGSQVGSSWFPGENYASSDLFIVDIKSSCFGPHRQLLSGYEVSIW